MAFSAISLLGLVRSHQGVLTGRAECTAAAGDDKGNEDTVPSLELRDTAPCFGDDAHEFMPEYVPVLDGRDEPVVEMEVRAAYGGRSHLHDDICRIRNDRVGDILDAYGITSPEHNSVHGRSYFSFATAERGSIFAPSSSSFSGPSSSSARGSISASSRFA